MSDSEEVTLSQPQQTLLNEIRNKQKDERVSIKVSRGHSTSTSDEVSGAHSGVAGPHREGGQSNGSVSGRKKRSTSVERTVYGYDQGSGPIEPAHVNALESNDRDSEEAGPLELIVDNWTPSDEAIVTPQSEGDKERERELNRQRQQRHREKAKQAQLTGVSVTQNVTSEKGPIFALKNLVTPSANSPLKKKEDVKLITKQESEELIENLAYIYQHGSGLLDDILEIIVKGHDAVEIWQLDEDEARTLAKMHLDKGRVSKEAAASARKLVSIYDQLFFIMLLGPRAGATFKHIKEHGGLGFK